MYTSIKTEVITSAGRSSSESPFPPLIFTQRVKVIQLQLSLLLSMALQRKSKFNYQTNQKKTKSQSLASGRQKYRMSSESHCKSLSHSNIQTHWIIKSKTYLKEGLCDWDKGRTGTTRSIQSNLGIVLEQPREHKQTGPGQEQTHRVASDI